MTPIDELLKELSEDGKDALLLIRELSKTLGFYHRLLDRFELDSLTGLPGVNKFTDYRAKLEEQNKSTGVGVIMFDVNDLKYYNDCKGHQAGDLLLQKAAESFHAICTGQVRVFRTGGDEFIGFITGCMEKDIDGVVAKWQKRLVELNTVDDGIRCTIAWGAAWGAPASSISDTLQLADERMYAEKRKMKERGEKIGEIR